MYTAKLSEISKKELEKKRLYELEKRKELCPST